MTTGGPRVDAMVEGDVPAVLAIDAQSFGRHEGGPSDALAGMGEAQLREELGRSWSHLWVVRMGSAVVAFLLAWHVADELHILNVATHPAARRRGHARALLRHTLDFARSVQVRLVLLEVRSSNEGAQALYRELGFRDLGVRARYYSDGEDAIEMALELDPITGAIVHHEDDESEDR